ncbi:hypothetical protein R1sor_027142 [Riccia sorocarpa]|uniref:Uncharacterized protein n=1 Tax=Riccia sorocarpa TaxID=122646 RepID=A0ABD3GJ50_9MARC
MSGSGKEVQHVPPPSGPGRGRPKKVRPRENETGNGTGILADVKRRKKISSTVGETGELESTTLGMSSENVTSVIEPGRRSAVRIESQSSKKRKQSASKDNESATGIELASAQGGETDAQEEEKTAALEAVLEVHGVCSQAHGGPAAFPGEAGQDIGDHPHSCACCMKPEILKLTLICDNCDRAFHLTCLNLDFRSTGLDDWLCNSCRSAYTESAVVGNVAKAIRQDIERRLFSHESKAAAAPGILNELQPEVLSNGVDGGQSITAVTSASDQVFQGQSETNNPNIFNGDEVKRSSTQQNVLSQRPLLDLNKVDESAASESPRRKLDIDLNDSRAPEFEDNVSMMDVSSELDEVKAVAVNDLMPEPAGGEPCVNPPVVSFNLNVSEEVDLASLKGLEVSRIDEALAMRNAVAESCAVLPAAASSDMRESCVDENKHCIIAQATVSSEAKSPGLLEDQLVKTSRRESFCTMGFTDGKEEALGEQSTGGEPVPLTQTNSLGSPRRDALGAASSVMPSAELISCPAEIATDANGIVFENGCVVFTDSQNAPPVDGSVTDVAQEVIDLEKCSQGNHLGQDELESTAEHANKTEQPGGNVGDKYEPKAFLEPAVVAISETSNWGENPKDITMADFLSPSIPTLTVLAATPTSTGDVGGIQAEYQQSKKPAEMFVTPVSNADKVSCMTTALNSPLTGQPVDLTSPSVPDDPQLKKVGADTLQQLRDSLQKKHGLTLADGWEVEVRKRRNDKHLDKYYISPEKHRFRSRIEVLKHLGLWEGGRGSPKLKCEAQQLHFKESSPIVQPGAAGNAQLPLKLGDFTLESLGVIDLRPRYWDEQHIWPVGYRCTWHDRTTSSFCISEIAEGGWGPIFRVTRKYCPTVINIDDSERNAVKVSNETISRTLNDSQGDRENITTASADRMQVFPHGTKSQLASGFGVEDNSLKALSGNVNFPLNLNQEAEHLSGDIKSGETENPQDVVGEFTVEASTTVEAWKRYAEKFIERCGKLSDVVGSVVKPCPHKTCASTGVVPMEVLDPENILGKLGEDRFGLDEIVVRELIETLPNSDRCSGYKPLKERVVPREAEDLVVGASVQPQRIRIRDKARKQKKGLEFQSLAAASVAAAAEPIVENRKEEVVAPVSLTVFRQPPPPGVPLELRLPTQYVGDVLQIWEFLCRFSSLIGFSQPPALEDLEEGLSCGSVNGSGIVDPSCSRDVPGGEASLLDSKLGSDERACRPGDAGQREATSATLETTETPRTPGKKFPPGRSNLGSSVPVPQRKDAGPPERPVGEDRNPIRSPSNDTISLTDVRTDHEVFSTDAHAVLPEPELTDEEGLASAAFVHVPVIKFLIGDLQSKICGFEELPGTTDELKHKRGRKRVREIVANACFGREKLTDSFSINQLTWPEVARRYMISLSRIKEIGETADFGREECMKILRCIQGDGGVLCGALDGGVAGMEIDAQLLAEAEKEISSLMPRSEETAGPSTPPRNTSARDPEEDFRGGDGESPLWIKHLDPIAKLPTNVGSRIRNRIIDALGANPPPWAVEILEYSISKNVYKGNASGPTKRAVMEVLHKFRGEDPGPKVKKTKKQRKRVLPSPEIVMQRCRIVLRQVATADTLRVVSKSFKCVTNFYESEGEGLLARPLDFRAIDLRLGAGAYGTSPDAFAADIKQIWKNLAEVYDTDSPEASAADELEKLFDSLYKKQVTLFQKGGEQAAKAASEGKTEAQSKDSSQKNATEDKPPGSDKPVKAPWEDDSCQVCGIDDDHDNVLLCDGCDAEYHIYCLTPPLPEVPDGNWFCNSCVAVDSGFLEAPSAPEISSETKGPEKQQEDHQMEGSDLEQVVERDQLPTSTGSTLPSFSALALQLAATDYWHLSLEERIHLVKWLCDQALETRKLRSHLDKSMDIAVDLQQELRALLRAERRKNADSDEVTKLDSGKDGSREGSIQSILQSRSAVLRRPDEIVDDKSAQVNAVDVLSASGSSAGTAVETGILKASNQNLVLATPSLTEHEGKIIAFEHSVQSPVVSDSAVATNCQQLKGQDVQNFPLADGRNESAEVPLGIKLQVPVEPRNLFSSFDKDPDSERKVPKDEPVSCPEVEAAASLDNTFEQKPSTSVDGEVDKVNTKLALVSGRRDLLGRDELGRVYWTLCGAKSGPWLAVETDSNTRQTEGKNGMSLGSSAVFPWMERLEGKDILTMPGVSSRFDDSGNETRAAVKKTEGQGQQAQFNSWHIYPSESMVDKLIGWLSSSSSSERLLKSTLLQWKSLLLLTKDEQDAGYLRRGILASPRSRGQGFRITNSQPSLPESVQRSRSFMPSLKASYLLEWKCGQFSDPPTKSSAASGGSKRGRKRKAQPPSELTRCDCLEPVWASRYHCIVCHTTYETEGEFQAHKTGGSCQRAEGKGLDRQGDMRLGKKACLNSKSVLGPADSHKPTTRPSPAGMNTLPDVSKMPMIVQESLGDRVKRIGYGSDKGPLFAPGLAISPAFDPALMIGGPLALNSGSEADAKGIIGTLAVGATVSSNHTGHSSLNGYIVEDMSRWENTEALNYTGHATAQTMSVSGNGGPLPTELNRSEEDSSIQKQAAVSDPAHGSASLGASDLSNEQNGRTSVHEGHSKTFRVTGKELTIPESSLRPLESEEDLNVLQQLKAKLLDIEAAVTQDMSEKARAYQRRRQAWRSMVKRAVTIYKVVQAIILLEQMISADFLRTSWCYWSSLTVAAKTATLSSLFLRVYALDAAILYEKSESYAGADLTNRQVKHGKQDKSREAKKSSSLKPRKKKKETIAVS